MAYNKGVFRVSGYSTELIKQQVRALRGFFVNSYNLEQIVISMSTLELVESVVHHANRIYVEGPIDEESLLRELLPALEQRGKKCTALHFRSPRILQMPAAVAAFQKIYLRVFHGAKLLGGAPPTPYLLPPLHDPDFPDPLNDDEESPQEKPMTTSEDDEEECRRGYCPSSPILLSEDEEEEYRRGYCPSSPTLHSESEEEEYRFVPTSPNFIFDRNGDIVDPSSPAFAPCSPAFPSSFEDGGSYNPSSPTPPPPLTFSKRRANAWRELDGEDSSEWEYSF